MSNLNKVMLIGRLGKDPELKRVPSGAAVVEVTIATSENFKDKNGNKQDKTEWHSVVFWNKTAETVAQYLKKGSLVYVEGKLQTRSWDDQNGQKRYKTEIVANSFQFMESRGGSNQGQSYQAPVAPASNQIPAMPIDSDLPF